MEALCIRRQPPHKRALTLNHTLLPVEKSLESAWLSSMTLMGIDGIHIKWDELPRAPGLTSLLLANRDKG